MNKKQEQEYQLEIGRLKGKLEFRDRMLKEYEEQLALDFVEESFVSKLKIRKEIINCKQALKTCNKASDLDRIKALNERIMAYEDLL